MKLNLSYAAILKKRERIKKKAGFVNPPPFSFFDAGYLKYSSKSSTLKLQLKKNFLRKIYNIEQKASKEKPCLKKLFYIRDYFFKYYYNLPLLWYIDNRRTYWHQLSTKLYMRVLVKSNYEHREYTSKYFINLRNLAFRKSKERLLPGSIENWHSRLPIGSRSSYLAYQGFLFFKLLEGKRTLGLFNLYDFLVGVYFLAYCVRGNITKEGYRKCSVSFKPFLYSYNFYEVHTLKCALHKNYELNYRDSFSEEEFTIFNNRMLDFTSGDFSNALFIEKYKKSVLQHIADFLTNIDKLYLFSILDTELFNLKQGCSLNSKIYTLNSEQLEKLNLVYFWHSYKLYLKKLNPGNMSMANIIALMSKYLSYQQILANNPNVSYGKLLDLVNVKAPKLLPIMDGILNDILQLGIIDSIKVYPSKMIIYEEGKTINENKYYGDIIIAGDGLSGKSLIYIVKIIEIGLKEVLSNYIRNLRYNLNDVFNEFGLLFEYDYEDKFKLDEIFIFFKLYNLIVRELKEMENVMLKNGVKLQEKFKVIIYISIENTLFEESFFELYKIGCSSEAITFKKYLQETILVDVKNRLKSDSTISISLKELISLQSIDFRAITI